MFNNSNTESIDVGSMFLMDLSVHDSDLNETYSTTTTLIDKDSVFPTQTDLSSSSKCILDKTSSYNYLNSTSNKQDHQQIGSLSSSKRIAYHRSTQRNYLGNSLDRLASAIDGSPGDDVLDLDQYARNINDNFDNDETTAAFGRGEKVSQVTVVEPQPLPELENQLSSASSLSDESFVASGGSSTSYTISCESVEDGDDRESTTTREDSGVLDIKDLDNQLSNSFDNEHEEEIYQHQRLHHHNQEKPISSNVTATNLTNKSVNNNGSQNNALTKHQQHHQSRPNKNIIPTNNHHSHNNHHHHSSTNHSQPLRSMSASLPIEVPPRQMKRELKKSKNDYKNQASNKIQAANASASAFDEVRDNDEFLDDDFLEQEYNENHHNHYPIDEFDEEHLRAEDNPMKLFESIQALARSLHEDTEIFGSLPPKRLLESPIRSLAFA